ncbi:MAG: lysylphosphatidylglycerol synthase domain-containing protein [Solirubrobacteraceae bacterium]
MTATAPENRSAAAGARMPDELNPRHLVGRLLVLALLIGLVAAAVGSLPGLGTLRARFAQAEPLLLALICVLKLGSCLSNVVAFRDVFCSRMSWRFSYQLGMAEQATNVLVPTGGAGGLALGAWALRQGGMTTEHIGRRSVAFFVLTSLPNFACAALLGPLLLTGLFSGDVPVVPTVVFSALALTVAAVIAGLPWWLLRVDPDKAGGPLARRLRSGAFLLGAGIRDTGILIRDRQWRAIGGALGYLGFDIAALIAAFAAFGGGVPLGPLVFAYVIGQLGGLIPLPAGIGGTDGGLIGAMVLYGSPLPQAAAAVLAYRAFQLGVPAVLGAIAFVQLRRTLNRSAAPASACNPLAIDG